MLHQRPIRQLLQLVQASRTNVKSSVVKQTLAACRENQTMCHRSLSHLAATTTSTHMHGNDQVCLQRSLPQLLYVPVRHKKGMDKQSRKGQKGSVVLEDSEMEEFVDIHHYRLDLDRILDEMRQEFLQNLSLRTNIGVYGKLNIKTNDGTFPLNQIAAIVQKSPTLVVINMGKSAHYIANVMSTLTNSGMNLNPQQEGQATIYLAIPKVSTEHREKLSKSAKTIFNKTKDNLNGVYSKYLKNAGQRKQALPREVNQQMLMEKDDHVKNAEIMMKAKIDELMG
ncbi:ribosome-recycling factor, mitochondrial-like [Mya arenaria]|uniref:ribosome-recycling factor, mitochondrial-like n=1 Tax=Mya arenaria TaxID=6604 RepID=UPI0022E0E202|nr:ribosome-recycling factor, mitochondrial-like [Mya arenaria]XP_052788923.1 ribosome-recycling factor, mitochondrial-like [Mya arenaria]